MTGRAKPGGLGTKSLTEALNLRVSPGLMQAIKRAAHSEAVPVADIVRQALERDTAFRTGTQPERVVTLAELDRRVQQLLDQQASILVYQTGSAEAAHTSALQAIKIMTALSHVMQALGLDRVSG
jgi:SLT domain-containing protein